MAAEGRKFRKFRDFHTPGFIVAQVEMQHVEFVGSHDVQHLQHFFLAAEVADHIQHEAAQPQVRPVFDDHVRQFIGQFVQGLLSVNLAFLIDGKHGYFSPADGNAIPAFGVFRLACWRIRTISDGLRTGNHLPGLHLVAGGKPIGIYRRTLMLQEAVGDRKRLIGLAFLL